MNPIANLAPGIKDIASAQKTSFATTQAIWRFLNNDRISFQQLNQPLQTLASKQLIDSNHNYALVAHDWSQLQYVQHSNKINRRQRTHAHDTGYELQSSLLIDADQGLPLAPLAQTLCDSTGRYSTFQEYAEKENHLNALMQQIDHIESMNLDKKLVHIIDREGDSIAHLREMQQKGYSWLVRVKEGNLVEFQGQSHKIKDVANQIISSEIKKVDFKGQEAVLHVGETQICITRAAKPKGIGSDGKRLPEKKGAPLTARLIVAEVKDSDGTVKGRWCLVSNVSSTITAVELSTWYYWRWTIESFFKLLKQAGHDVESWLQTSPEAILRRLLISCMACALTWRIQRSNDEQNAKVRIFLTRISGRVQKRGKRESAPAILAGLSILLNTLKLLSEYSESDLREMAEIALGYPHRDV